MSGVDLEWPHLDPSSARATRANGYQGFDANGDPTIKASVDLSGTSVSAFMNDLLDSADSTAS